MIISDNLISMEGFISGYLSFEGDMIHNIVNGQQNYMKKQMPHNHRSRVLVNNYS